MSGFFRRFVLGDHGPPPPPDVGHQPSFSDQSVVDTVYSDSKQERAIITRDESGTFRVYVQWWDTSDWRAGHGAFWYGHGSGSYTDNLETARSLAGEALRGAARHDS